MVELDYTKLISNIIQKNAENICKGIYTKGEKTYKQLITNTGIAFNSYLNSSVNKFKNVKTIINNHRPVSLYEFYVDVNIKCGDDIINTDTIENILRYNNCITIFGSGGTGKSTLFKHLFLDTIRSTELIPIFVELKNINNKEYKNIEEFIYDSLINLNFSLEKEYFLNSLKNGKYVIFLDGYDEIKENKKTIVSDEIIRITNKYDNNYYIVSSRKNNMLERGWDNFCDFTMEPLSEEKAIQLIKNLNYDEDIKNRFLYQLQEEELFKKHKSFCSNPLLLTIMLLTYQEFAEIPDKLHIFYGRAFDVLYSKHDATKGSFVREKRLEKQGLASDDFKNVLSTFSAISYSDSKINFEYDSLIDYIQKAKEFSDLKFDSNDFLIDLVEAVCILTLDGSEYKYQHRSFQEYFTAKFINNLTDDEQKEFLNALLEENSNSLRTDTVFTMLFEMNQTKLEKNLLIPTLEVLKDLISDPDEQKTEFKFVNLMYHRAMIEHVKETEHEYRCSFGIKSRKKMKYINIARFIARKYKQKMDNIPEEYINTFDKQTTQNKYQEIYNNGIPVDDYLRNGKVVQKVTLDFDEALNNDQIYQDILKLSETRIQDLKFSLYILDQLKEKYKNKKSMKELFSKTK
uniref:NACHT domain-containing protein n=1 Tax=Bacillus multifaciens TaxID=3068506 RepID=UPI003F494318